MPLVDAQMMNNVSMDIFAALVIFIFWVKDFSYLVSSRDDTITL